MKTFVASIALFCALSLHAVQPFTNATWGLSWDQPTNMPVLTSYVPGTNQAYQVYTTQNLGTPLASWTLSATWTNWFLVTNSTGAIQLSNNITVPFATTFFYVNPTNVFGAAPLFSGYGGMLITGPPWSVVNDSTLNRQGP